MRNSGLLHDSLPGCDMDVARKQRSTRRSSAALVVATLLIAAPAHADWRRDYDRGTKALAEQRWQEAEQNFASALREDGNAKERRRFEGQRYAAYVPHYYAGLAAWRQGACERAIGYWKTPVNATVIAGLPELKTLQDQGLADCQQKLAQTTRPATPPPATTTSSTTSPATTTPATTKPTTPVAQQTPPDKPVAQTPAKPTQTPTTPAKPAAGPAPAALVAAVEAWIAGRHANVIQADPAAAGDARAHLLLLRAAARHMQAELAGGDAAQLEQARADVRAAKAANAALTPDASLFPPRFRTFWQQTK